MLGHRDEALVWASSLVFGWRDPVRRLDALVFGTDLSGDGTSP
jgi:hypothetical protein